MASLCVRFRVCSPHTRGDGPQCLSVYPCTRRFSPHAWGWSASHGWPLVSRLVLPTRVGMVRDAPSDLTSFDGSPHTRGDGPLHRLLVVVRGQFSPHAWGWSVMLGADAIENIVLPTRVGMVRMSVDALQMSERSPHTRGDGPRRWMIRCA